jgi:hypothetical protein
LLTAAAVVVSFLGGRAVDDHRFPLLVVAGMLLFVLSLLLILTVLIPSRRRKIKEIASGGDLFELDLDPEAPTVDGCVQLTHTYDQIYQDNDQPKRRLVERLVAAAALLVLQIGTWGTTILLAESHAAPRTPAIACIKATIRGRPKCLARGQLCDRRNERRYELHLFICTSRAGDGRPRLR